MDLAQKRHNDEAHTTSAALLTVRQFCEKNAWPTESAMRSMIFRADDMGLRDAFIKVNRRVLVDSCRFCELIRQQQLAAPNQPPLGTPRTALKK